MMMSYSIQVKMKINLAKKFTKQQVTAFNVIRVNRMFFLII